MPLHVEYALTDLGHSAAKPLSQLRTWAENNLDAATHPEAVTTPDPTEGAAVVPS